MVAPGDRRPAPAGEGVVFVACQLNYAPRPARVPAARPAAAAGGFTLVELLVVIGIIALLIGILMPALTAAQAQSRGVACLSNVRQIAIAAQMYAEDARRYVAFVPAVPATGQPARDRKELLFPYLQQGRNNADNTGNQVWMCPSNQRVEEEASYGFNTNLNGVRITMIRKWSETVALCDAGLKDQAPGEPSLATHCWPPGKSGSSSSCRPNDRRHRKGLVSVGYADGHAEQLPMAEPFYPGPVGTWNGNDITDSTHPDYKDGMWDLQ